MFAMYLIKEIVTTKIEIKSEGATFVIQIQVNTRQ